MANEKKLAKGKKALKFGKNKKMTEKKLKIFKNMAEKET